MHVYFNSCFSNVHSVSAVWLAVSFYTSMFAVPFPCPSLVLDSSS